MNEITNNTQGIVLNVQEEESYQIFDSNRNDKSVLIFQNNFKRNLMQTWREYFYRPMKISWLQNYWGRPRLLPNIILLFFMITEDFGIPTNFELDLRPALKPYALPDSVVNLL
jgi:hypothetical protein